MLNRLFAVILVYAFTFNAIANVNNQSLSSLLLKYEYALTAHPNAHEAEFRSENINKMKEVVSEYASQVSKDVLKNDFNKIVERIPSAEKRELFLETIENSSFEELKELATNEAILNQAFRGDSSNFSVNDGVQTYHIIYAVTIGLFLYLLLSGESTSKDYDFFSSRTVWVSAYTSSDFYICSGSDLFPFEAQSLQNEARQSCINNSPNPDTCAFAGYSATTQEPLFDYQPYTCMISALYSSKKLQVTE